MPLEKIAMRFVLLAAPLLLAGCGSDEPADNAANVAAPVLRKGPMLGSVDLSQAVRASGTSPFWALEIAPGRITYTDFAGKDAKVTDFYPVSPRLDADHAVFPTQTPEGETVTITLTRAACNEKGAPPVTDPLTAELKIGARVLTGCARTRPADAIQAEPEPANASAVPGNVTG
jgi:uncharacterized membrane protein